MKAVFFRLLESDDKSLALRELISGTTGDHSAMRFVVDPTTFSRLPRSPFAYWVTGELAAVFERFPRFIDKGRDAKVGLQTSDDFRFVRATWEVDAHQIYSTWFAYPKGGSYSPFYADIHLVVNWGDDGREVKGYVDPQTGKRLSYPRNSEHYFRPGLTWPARPYKRGGFSLVPRDAIFSISGMMVVAETPEELLPLGSLLNSDAYIGLLHLLMARGSEGSDRTLKYEAGYVTAVPIPDMASEQATALGELFIKSWAIRRSLASSDETDLSFLVAHPLGLDGETLAARVLSSASMVAADRRRLAAAKRRIDEIAFALYGLSDDDRTSIAISLEETDSSATAAEEDGRGESNGAVDQAGSSFLGSLSPLEFASQLFSWCVGCAFGRFDIRAATSEREPSPRPDPFDPLPVCSPGMLTGEEGLPLEAPPSGYPIAWSEDGISVDDPGHPRDLTAAVRGVFDVVFGADADAFWTEAAELVDPKGQDTSRWLRKTYFQEHIRRYSKSRRKAPIYWQLATPSASYSVWLYAHRIGRDSLYQVLNDFVSPKLQAEERKLHALREEAGENPSSSQRKELAAQASFVSELSVLKDEVARVAPLWNPDLNDGVVIVTAPLHRLVPQLKSWQKELKTHWDALAAGKYDWAQLAMHLWPERVVPKCAEDRSLAIAHDLENVFWDQDADGKWHARKEPTRSVNELIAERTSPAVKDALENLMAAPPLTTGKRSRRFAA